MIEYGLKVTIAITCFNAVHTIQRALTSAQRQEWAHLEILVADDCSSDGSADFVETLIENDPRARLIRRQQNGGAAATRNTLIEAASGDFIAFFDDDDESHPERVSRQLSVLLAFELDSPDAIAACYAGGERVYANGYVKPLPAIGSRGAPLQGNDVANYLLFFARPEGLFFGAGTPTCALMARRRLFLDLGGFDASLRRVEDLDFAVRLALAGGYFLGTSDCLFRQHATQGIDKSPEANRDAEVRLARKHAGYLRAIGKYHYAVRWPNLRFLHYKRRYAAFLLEFIRIFGRNPVTATRHILETGPRRLRHERQMRKRLK
jgi:glycosyltransferase involved in cell wall biosynthesis